MLWLLRAAVLSIRDVYKRQEELRRYVDTDEPDELLIGRLDAIETALKGYTANNFTRVLQENGGEWPADIRMGVVKMIKWDMGTGEKVGICLLYTSRCV